MTKYIGSHMEIGSTNGVHDHLIALERKGFIKLTSKSRGIEFTHKAMEYIDIVVNYRCGEYEHS